MTEQLLQEMKNQEEYMALKKSFFTPEFLKKLLDPNTTPEQIKEIEKQMSELTQKSPKIHTSNLFGRGDHPSNGVRRRANGTSNLFGRGDHPSNGVRRRANGTSNLFGRGEHPSIGVHHKANGTSNLFYEGDNSGKGGSRKSIKNRHRKNKSRKYRK